MCSVPSSSQCFFSSACPRCFCYSRSSGSTNAAPTCSTVRLCVSFPVSLLLVFFFSSRRRHTRCLSDWSSDVCSSDLGLAQLSDEQVNQKIADMETARKGRNFKVSDTLRAELTAAGIVVENTKDGVRSEERRVGKECRSRWSPYH